MCCFIRKVTCLLRLLTVLLHALTASNAACCLLLLLLLLLLGLTWRWRVPCFPPLSVRPGNMVSAPSRLAMRLAELSHAQLLQIALAGCEASSDVNNLADAFFAEHKPLPQWAVESVLLSDDLVPHVLAPLELEDGAAAAVCSCWADAWKATGENRRHLRRVPFSIPQELLGMADYFELATIPGGNDGRDWLLVRSGGTVRVLLRSVFNPWLERDPIFDHFERDDSIIAADARGIYVVIRRVHGDEVTVRRFTYFGNECASYEDATKFPFRGVLAPNGLLFCVGQVRVRARVRVRIIALALVLALALTLTLVSWARGCVRESLSLSRRSVRASTRCPSTYS